MNPLDAQGLQSSPLTNPAAASSGGASSSSSTDEKITQVISANESGPHQAVAASSQSLEGRKLSQENPPPVVLDLSDDRLSDEDRVAQIQNSGGTITLLKLGNHSPSSEFMIQIAEFCPQLKELELHSYWRWGLDLLTQAQIALPKEVLLTNPCYSLANREELEKYLDYCAPFGGPTCLRLEMINDLTQSELDELIEGAPNLRYLNINSNQLTELSAPKARVIECRHCTSLQSIRAPEATTINCVGCNSLQSLSAPNARKIDCWGCTGLQSISTPKAREVRCWDCTGLQSISAPKATAINCGDCTGLQSISAPSATWIDCQRCTGLQSISAPKATNIFCGGCTGLQSLNVPLSAISGWEENPQLSLEMLQMGAKMPGPEEMKALEASHPELAQKMRKLTVLTLQDLARNCVHGNSQIETEGFPAPLLQYEDIETAYP